MEDLYWTLLFVYWLIALLVVAGLFKLKLAYAVIMSLIIALVLAFLTIFILKLSIGA